MKKEVNIIAEYELEEVRCCISDTAYAGKSQEELAQVLLALGVKKEDPSVDGASN